MRTLILSSAVGLMFSTLSGAPSSAAVLLSENFDELTPMLSATSVGAFHTINGTNVDIVGPGLFGSLCASPESGNGVDMNGTGGNPQGQLQSNASFTLIPGTRYLLSFDLIGSQRGVTASTTVSFGPYDQTFTLASGDNSSGIVSNAVITVASTTVAFLTFASNTPGEEGNLLDNVSISTSATAVPEPSDLTLLGSACAGLGFVRRWRRGRVAQPA
jgi:hypothetical protein